MSKKFYNIGPRRKRELSEVVTKTSDKDENPDSIQTTADYYEATDILVSMLYNSLRKNLQMFVISWSVCPLQTFPV